MLIILEQGAELPEIDGDLYVFSFCVPEGPEERRIMHCMTILDTLTHFDECYAITQPMTVSSGNAGDILMVTLLTPTLGLQHEFMDCHRAIYKTYYNEDFTIDKDPTDWSGSILRHADIYRHN